MGASSCSQGSSCGIDHRKCLNGVNCFPESSCPQSYGANDADGFDSSWPKLKDIGGAIASKTPMCDEHTYIAKSCSSRASSNLSRGRVNFITETADRRFPSKDFSPPMARCGSDESGDGTSLSNAPSTWSSVDAQPAAVIEREASLPCSYFEREINELPLLPQLVAPDQRHHRRYAFQTGSVYDGQWLGNKRHGFGVQTWLDGASYEGEWGRNVAVGRGRFRHSDGDVYIGEWVQNIAHGAGKYTRRDGTTYEGQFVDDSQHGYGLEVWPDNARFAGQFLQGQKSGHGIYEWSDGSAFAGEWADNQIGGFGSYTGADGRRFDGLWRASMMHGCGRYAWPDGKLYCGQYVADHKEGFGTFSWVSGRRYEGYWQNGRQHGIGRLCPAPDPGELEDESLAVWHNGECTSLLTSPSPQRVRSTQGHGQGAAAPCTTGGPPLDDLAA